MRNSIKLIAYILAFTFVMPQISIRMMRNEVVLTFVWMLIFIVVVEAIVNIFDWITRRYKNNQTENK